MSILNISGALHQTTEHQTLHVTIRKDLQSLAVLILGCAIVDPIQLNVRSAFANRHELFVYACILLLHLPGGGGGGVSGNAVMNRNKATLESHY